MSTLLIDYLRGQAVLLYLLTVRYNISNKGDVRSRQLYGMNCRPHRPLHCKPKIMRIGRELMKLSRFPDAFSLVSLIGRNLTAERYRKETSNRDNCTG